jgi:hypothetical protein
LEQHLYRLNSEKLLKMSVFLEFCVVQRAGFEPANPYGKGFPIIEAISGQMIDLESFTFDLAWLPLLN